jgi:hypothetical protein
VKPKAIVVSFACLLAVLLGLPAVSSAQTFVGTIPDGRVSDTVNIAAAATVCFYFFGIAGRSYSIEVQGSIAANTTFTEFFGAVGEVCPVATAAGYTITTTNDPPHGGPGGNPAAFGRRASFVAPSTGLYMVTVNNTGGITGAFKYSVSDTTLFNPLWSTFGGFETFYKFYNTTSASCSVTLSLRNDNNTVRAASTFSLAADNTSATRTTGSTDLNVTNDVAGHAFITHDCPPGAIQVDGFLGFFGATTSVLPIKIVAARESAH